MLTLRSSFHCALALSAVVGLSAAQGTVLRVGPTRTFTQITEALNQAYPGVPGDLILVDPGAYDPFRIEGSVVEIAIVAAAGSFNINDSPGVPEIFVSDLAVGGSVTIVGAHIAYADPQAPAVEVSHNEGAVRFRRLVVDQVADLDETSSNVRACVQVDSTQTFWLLDSSIEPECTDVACLPLPEAWNPVPIVLNGLPNDGISAIELHDSGAIIQNTRARGYNNKLGNMESGFGGDGLRVVGDFSSAWLLQDKTPLHATNLQGGYAGGQGWGGHAVHQVSSVFEESRVRSCGGPDNAVSLTYAPGAGGTIGGIYGWNNTNGIVGNSFQIVEHCHDAQRNETAVLSDTVSIGTNLSIRLRTKLARQYVVVVSLDTQYVFPLPGLTGRGVAGSAYTTLSGTTSPQTFHTLTLPVPNQMSLIGRQIAVQGAFGPVGGTYTNAGLPGMVVIGP